MIHWTWFMHWEKKKILSNTKCLTVGVEETENIGGRSFTFFFSTVALIQWRISFGRRGRGLIHGFEVHLTLPTLFLLPDSNGSLRQSIFLSFAGFGGTAKLYKNWISPKSFYWELSKFIRSTIWFWKDKSWIAMRCICTKTFCKIFCTKSSFPE